MSRTQAGKQERAYAGKQARRELLRRVRAGDVLYAHKITCSRTVIVLRMAGVEISFLYSSTSKRILSFMPPGAPETEGWRQSRPQGEL